MQVTVMNFSGVYKPQTFYKNIQSEWLECADISGTNAYCDEEAEQEIQKRMGARDARGVHFIDSGNYHYVSKLWLERVNKPFELIVFDNHTDMQPPMFGDILSCGSWIKRALETNENLKKVVLIGPPKSAWEELLDDSRIRFVSREELAACTGEEAVGSGTLPVYVSIDKDVLAVSEAQTNWDQGEMLLERLLEMIQAIRAGRDVIGWDVCGEDPERAESEEYTQKADQGNEKLLCAICGL